MTVAAAAVQVSAADELRAYLAGIVPEFRAQWGGQESFPAALAWQRLLHAGGWAAPSWPVAAGGRGLGVVDRVACDLELAAVDAPVAAGVLGLNNVGPALILFGDDQQRLALPLILAGDQIWAQGFSEPGAGSDLAALATAAVAVPGGFLVNGQKLWTSQGMEATHMMLLVRSDPTAAKHKGISVLLVDLGSPGIERRPVRQLTGASEFAEIFFTDVFVPDAALLGPLHEGWRVTMTTLGYERSGVVAMAVRLQREVEVLIAGVTVTDPHLRDQLLRRYIEARVTGLMGARALAALSEGQEPGAAQSVIKFAWSLAVAHLGETMLDLAGSQGLLAGDPATQRFLSSRAATIAAGTTEIMKDLLAERVLGLPRG